MSSAAKQDPHVEEDVRILLRGQRDAQLELEDGKKIWIPLSACEIEPTDDGYCRVEMDHWFATQEGLL